MWEELWEKRAALCVVIKLKGGKVRRRISLCVVWWVCNIQYM